MGVAGGFLLSSIFQVGGFPCQRVWNPLEVLGTSKGHIGARGGAPAHWPKKLVTLCEALGSRLTMPLYQILI